MSRCILDILIILGSAGWIVLIGVGIIIVGFADPHHLKIDPHKLFVSIIPLFLVIVFDTFIIILHLFRNKKFAQSEKRLWFRIILGIPLYGNILYYFRVMRDDLFLKKFKEDKITEIKTSEANLRKLILDLLCGIIILCGFGFVVSFAFPFIPSFDEIISNPVTRFKIMALPFKFLPFLLISFFTFVFAMAHDRIKRSDIELGKIDHKLIDFPHIIFFGKGAFQYYFKILRKELAEKKGKKGG